MGSFFYYNKRCVGVSCVKRPFWVRRPFAVILLLMLPLAGLGAYNMCISVDLGGRQDVMRRAEANQKNLT
jgi:hypothetical protein